MHRATYCARNDPLPLLPSGPGGVGGITSRRTRHRNQFTTQKPPSLDPASPHPCKTHLPALCNKSIFLPQATSALSIEPYTLPGLQKSRNPLC